MALAMLGVVVVERWRMSGGCGGGGGESECEDFHRSSVCPPLCLTLHHVVCVQLYRIQNPQSPLVQNEVYRRYAMDEYPSGANAVVAVISYTGFDMEDAMIINKSSFERGFGHASVYKTIVSWRALLRCLRCGRDVDV
jgi:hypothetical protein